MKKLADVDFSLLLPKEKWKERVPTSIDVDFSRSEAYILTSLGIIILDWNDLLEGINLDTPFRYLKGPKLPQQEALTLVDDGFVYTTEYVKKNPNPPIYFWSLSH
jgi:hypothetical protein